MISERLYRLLLLAYPRSFRLSHAADLIATYRAFAAEPRHAGALGRVRLWLFLVHDVAIAAPGLWLRAVRRSMTANRSFSRRDGTADATDPRRGTASAVASRRRTPAYTIPAHPWTTSASPPREKEHAMSGWLQDVRFALRGFGRTPGFAAAAVLTLALGIGSATTVFGVVDGVLLRPLPYSDAERLVQLGTTFDGDVQSSSTSPPDFFDLASSATTLESVAAARLQWMDAVADGRPERFDAAGVSASYFDVLDVRAAVGRVFEADDDRAGAAPVVVLGHGLWQRRWGGDRSVLGERLVLNDRSFEIIGVLPASFAPPEAIYHGGVELWFPLAHVGDALDDRSAAFLQTIGRVRAGVGLGAARSELSALGERLSAEYPDAGERGFWAEPLHARTVGDIGGTLFVLLGAVGVLLALACANVANLFLVRATDRARELAVRGALGAGRGRIARQLLTESVALALAGGVLGALLAVAGVRLFRALSPADIPRLAEVGVDLRVLGFALAVAVATGVLLGLLPALRAGGASAQLGLREAGRGASAQLALREAGRSMTPGRGRARVRGALVVAQTALAIVLLAGGGLLVNTLIRLTRVDAGFDARDVAWMRVSLPDRYDTAERRATFFDALLERVRALPGVESAGAVHGLPLDGNRSLAAVRPEGWTAPPGDDGVPAVSWLASAPGYFAALGIPLDGRDFEPADRAGVEPVTIVSRAFAARFWPGAAAIGRTIRFGANPDAPAIRVVGVASDVRQYGLAAAAEPMLYLPFAQGSRRWMAVTARHDGRDAGALIERMREAVWAMDPTLPIPESGTLAAHVAGSLVEPRFYATLLATFAALAALIAAVGLYGTLAYSVRLRDRELGIRMAFGANRRELRRLVVRHGMRLAGAGIAIGLAAALFATRALESFVFGIEPTDPLTLAAVGALMAAVAWAACWMPARRAAGAELMGRLRGE